MAELAIDLLASGSRGNALLVRSGTTRLLVDAGLSARELCRRLELVGVAPESLDAILVTHEHIDHVRGLGPLSRRLQLPVYLHHASAAALEAAQRPARACEFDAGTELAIGDLGIRVFPVTHDARAAVGMTVSGAFGRLGIVTDLGIATRLVAEELRGCRCLVVESNHDEQLLRDGPYPWPLKQRIRGSHGHLSNRDCATLLEGLCWPGLDAVCLAHLSETNNLPQLAEAAARTVLDRQTGCRPQLLVGRQDRPVGWSAASAPRS
jgi:phosphoribosyl 1,2-cyclic phosphodiesterase